MMKLYHVTTSDAAKAILVPASAIRPAPMDLAGLEFLVDRPLDCNDISADTILAVSLDCGPSDLSDYEWAQNGQSHQEWLIPADFVNKHTLAIVQLDRNFRRSA